MLIPIGVLPYPITFLCTDLVCEFYGKKRANYLVFGGLLSNVWVFFMMWVSGILPVVPEMNPNTLLPDVHDPQFAYYKVRLFALGGVIGSMLAYIAAQFLDVYLYQFWRKLTKGKHLWLRNNGSTLISQFVDTVIVILTSFWLVQGFPIEQGNTLSQLMTIIFSAYSFKVVVALLDTIPFYIVVIWLRKYLDIDTEKGDLELLSTEKARLSAE